MIAATKYGNFLLFCNRRDTQSFRTAPEPGYHDGSKFIGIQYTRDRARDGTGSIWRLQEELDGSAGLDDLDGPGDSEDLDDLERFRQTGDLGNSDTRTVPASGLARVFLYSKSSTTKYFRQLVNSKL